MSQRDLTPGGSVPSGGEVVFKTDFVQGERLEETLVGIPEMALFSSQAVELAARDHDSHRLASPGQFYFPSSLGLVDDGGKTGSGFGDGVPLGHAVVYIMMYMRTTRP